MQYPAETDQAQLTAAEPGVKSPAAAPQAFAEWMTRLEALLQHDPDGDQHVDGFSLDAFIAMEDAGLTPETAATRIGGSVFVTSTGDVYRLVTAGLDPLTDRYRERYQVMLASGAFTNADALPADSTHVWRPAVNPEYRYTLSGELRA